MHEEDGESSAVNAPFDAPAFMRRVGGDATLAAAMAALFLEECPRLLGDVRAAVAAADAESLSSAAHALKGSVGNFCADEASNAALRLELLGRSGDLEGTPEALRILEAALDRLGPALREIV